MEQFQYLIAKAKEVEQEVIKLKQYNEDLIYEKEQSTQKVIDLKAQLKFAVKEYRELNEIAYHSQERLKSYEKAFNELEESLEQFGEITGDKRFVEWVKCKKAKYNLSQTKN